MYKTKLINIGKRNSGIENEDNKWCIMLDGITICIVENYFKNPEGIANGIAASLNTNTKIKLDVSI